MSQNPLVDTTSSSSGALSSKPYRLKPALAAALASVEVQLDRELARYRRTKAGYGTLNQPRVGIINSQLQQLAAINTPGGKSQPLVEDSFTEGLKNVATTSSVRDPLEHEEMFVPETIVNTPLKSAPLTQQKVLPTAKAPKVHQKQESVVSSQTEELESSIPLDTAKTKTTPASNSISLMPINVKEHKHSKDFVAALQTLDDTHTQPEDYLESSEALLRSLTEEQTKDKKPTNAASDSLLSPLGIGSMLLLLVASMTLGYVVFNPKTLSQMSFDGWFKQKPSLNTENSSEGENKTTTELHPTLTPIPNLATDEFPELRNPNDVVGLKPKPKSISTPSPNIVPPPYPTNQSMPKTQPLVPTNPLPSTTTSQTPNTEIKPSADGYYHVVTDNKSDNTLAYARKVVPDAYLSTDGTLIYLGALTTKEKAQDLLQQLQTQGIKARIQNR